MKKTCSCLLAAIMVVLCLCLAAMPAAAACTPNTNGSYKPSMAKAAELVPASVFLDSKVTVNPCTHALNQVYDLKGNLVPATLSTDCHFYIVPTTEGYLYIPTGF